MTQKGLKCPYTGKIGLLGRGGRGGVQKGVKIEEIGEGGGGGGSGEGTGKKGGSKKL